jgi:hypothetical protein
MPAMFTRIHIGTMPLSVGAVHLPRRSLTVGDDGLC